MSMKRPGIKRSSLVCNQKRTHAFFYKKRIRYDWFIFAQIIFTTIHK